MMLSVLPLLRTLKDLQWLRAFMRGVGPAVIGALAVSLVQMAPHAAPDIFTWLLLALTIGLILLCNLGPLPVMAGGGLIGLLSRGNVLHRLAEFVR
jgi:chromate transporter